METICVILYVLIGYVTAVVTYITERQHASAEYVSASEVCLFGIFWPVWLLALSAFYIARAIAVSVVLVGEKLNSKLKE